MSFLKWVILTFYISYMQFKYFSGIHFTWRYVVRFLLEILLVSATHFEMTCSYVCEMSQMRRTFWEFGLLEVLWYLFWCVPWMTHLILLPSRLDWCQCLISEYSLTLVSVVFFMFERTLEELIWTWLHLFVSGYYFILARTKMIKWVLLLPSY